MIRHGRSRLAGHASRAVPPAALPGRHQLSRAAGRAAGSPGALLAGRQRCRKAHERFPRSDVCFCKIHFIRIIQRSHLHKSTVAAASSVGAFGGSSVVRPSSAATSPAELLRTEKHSCGASNASMIPLKGRPACRHELPYTTAGRVAVLLSKNGSNTHLPCSSALHRKAALLCILAVLLGVLEARLCGSWEQRNRRLRAQGSVNNEGSAVTEYPVSAASACKTSKLLPAVAAALLGNAAALLE